MPQKYNIEYCNETLEIYREIKPAVVKRIWEFKSIWKNSSDRDLFVELCFCIFTPQSSARSCWRAVERLMDKDLLFNGNFTRIRDEINLVRFRNNKASYLIEARERFMGPGAKSIRECLNNEHDTTAKREFLVRSVKGIGYKEASHYLRNIGLGNDIAILDRHILKNMVLLGVIDELPKNLSRERYIDHENRLKGFSDFIGIPMGHLDFVLWYKEAGEVFK